MVVNGLVERFNGQTFEQCRQVAAAVANVPVLRMESVQAQARYERLRRPTRRWVVERTFSWFGRNGPFAEDCEDLAGTLETFVTLAVIPARQDVGF